MRNWRMQVCVGVYFIMMAAGGCASDKPAPLTALAPPPNVDIQVLQVMTEGKRFFDEGRWEAARQQFQLLSNNKPIWRKRTIISRCAWTKWAIKPEQRNISLRLPILLPVIR